MKLITILDRSILIELFSLFFVTLFFFLIIFVMKYIFQLTDIIIAYNADLISIFLLLIYKIPYFLQYIIPIAIMMAVLITCLRMTEDNEIIALQSCGVNVHIFLKPLLIFAFIGMIFTMIFTFYFIPLGEKLSRFLSRDIISSSIVLGFRNRVFNCDFKSLMIYLDRINVEEGYLNDILIEDNRDEGVQNLIIASKGNFTKIYRDTFMDIKLVNGIIIRININNYSIHYIKFDKYKIKLNIFSDIKKNDLNKKTLKEMNFFDLRNFIAIGNKRSNMNIYKFSYYHAILQYYKIISIPFSCFPISILVMSLGLYKGKRTNSIGFGLGFFVFLGYYVLLSIGNVVGELGYLSPFLSAWIPNYLVLVLGLIFFRKISN